MRVTISKLLSVRLFWKQDILDVNADNFTNMFSKGISHGNTYKI